MTFDLGEALIKSVIIIGFLLTGFAYMTLFERRAVARLQGRLGPNRVGPAGLFQPIADGVKLVLKEQLTPRDAVLPLYWIAPAISGVVAFLSFAVIPVGPAFEVGGRTIQPWLADVSIGILYILAITSLGIYGIVLGGWASGNKYSLIGAIRSSAQMISYELSLGLSVLGVVMLAGTLSLTQIVDAQKQVWFLIPQFLGAIVYFIAGVAETNRAPFDLPEAEQELVAGYHTEYSGLRFTLYFMAEYINMITVSAIATTLFLGGWWGPFAPGPWWFLIKVAALLFVYIWLRATLPRLRYDQLMRFGWLVLLPLAVLNVVVTAVAVVFWG
ncbi:MAG TPA: NADH-quinone oxidoreductase subunit NuoH [Chloroflexia bacterium]|jgi:NADH-quinone oxidoreductase subunit H|nr:NADH-quinone oxidoreductase subunit NuoH [Chloroflexia bacterium]